MDNPSLPQPSTQYPPFAIGSVISQTWSAYRAHPLLFLGLCATAAVPLLLVVHVRLSSPALGFALTGVDQTANHFLAFAPICSIAVDFLDGRDGTRLRAFNRCRNSLFPLLCFSIFGWLAYSWALPAAAEWLRSINPAWFATVLRPAAVVWTVVAVYLAVTVQACVMERLGPIASLGRSWSLTRGHWWKLFALHILELLLLLVAYRKLAMYGVLNEIPYSKYVINIIRIVPLSVFCVMWAVVYRDLRMTKEGAAPDRITSVFS